MTLLTERSTAVEDVIAATKAIVAEKGVTRASLEAISERLVTLAERAELFPLEQFPCDPKRKSGLYRLVEDPDQRFALYASAGLPGKAQPPHDHTTWAIIAGVHGLEHNVRYERTDNRAEPSQARLVPGSGLTVTRGNAISFMAEDFHTIEVKGEEPALHLHFYGMSLENLPDRVTVDMETGSATRFMAKPTVLAPRVSAAEVKAMISDGGELGLFDVREEGEFAAGHLLFAAPLPLSKLELRAPLLAPRRNLRVVLMDAGDGRADRAASRLTKLGYRSIVVMEGGIDAWTSAGYELFTGVHVPSKAFGEVVEHEADTPRIEPRDLQAIIDSGRDLVILDSRPLSEYRAMSIPGGINVPGAELVYRIKDLAPDPKRLVIVNCAGRTRSIIGAQSLRNAGIENEVMALKNGTMGWHLAGMALDHGKTARYGDASPEAQAWAVARAADLRKRQNLSVIGPADLDRLRNEANRTVFLFDVRDPTEYAAGHRPDARSAPGGQLVQATDYYVGVRNARIIVTDNDGVRATMTASWLVQMGWTDVHILLDAMAGVGLVAGPAQAVQAPACPVATLTPAALKSAKGALVVDLDSSLAFRSAHIPGAWWAIGPRFSRALAKLPACEQIVLTSADGSIAALAAGEIAEIAGKPVLVLEGGTKAWIAAGFPTESGAVNHADETVDVWYRPYDNLTNIEEKMREYLNWEVDLTQQIARDGDARFKVLTA